MPFLGWSGWYQPADLVLDSTTVGLWGNNWSRTAHTWVGDTVFPDFTGVDFAAAAATLRLGDGPTEGAGHYDDYGDVGPDWNPVPNFPVYGVGFRGSAIAATEVFPAPSWNFQGESTVRGHSTAGLWTYAATVAADDPALPWTGPLPPNVLSVEDLEWEHALYPWEDSADYVGGTQFVWDTASCQFVSGYVTATVDASDSDATNEPWTLNMHAYEPTAFSDYAFMHPHGSPTTVSVYEGLAAADVDISLSSSFFPSGYPTLPPITTVDPGYPDFPSTPTEIVQNLASLGYPSVAVGFAHAGMVGGSWDYDVGDGSVDHYNTQRAIVSTTLHVVLRPSRVRFLFEYAEAPNLAGGPDKNRRRFETPGGVV